MGASLWDQVGLPLLIGLAIQIAVTALCFLSVRLWNCLMKQIKTQTAVEESAHDQPLPDAAANALPDLEMGNANGPAEGRQSMAEPATELETMIGGEGVVHFSDQEAHTPVIKSPLTITRDVARRALDRPVDMDVPRSQQEEENRLLSWLMNEAPVKEGCRCWP